MKKPSILLLSGNAEVGEDYVNYYGKGDDATFNPSPDNNLPPIPAPTADIRTNFTINEGGLSLDYYLNSKTSSFSINLWSQSDNLLLNFNEHPVFCRVKRFEPNGSITQLYNVGHSSAVKIKSTTKVYLKNNGGFINVFVEDVNIFTHLLPNSGLSVHFTASGDDGLKLNNIKLDTRTPKVFVIMQFNEEYNELYNEVIKPVCEAVGLKVIRVDESSRNGSIIEEIRNEIIDSTFVIADITPDNPNVYYEVGFAHGIKKKVILMCNQQRERLPFDLVDVRTIFYKNSISGNSAVKAKLEKQILEILEPQSTQTST